jgi:hypothetical protein
VNFLIFSLNYSLFSFLCPSPADEQAPRSPTPPPPLYLWKNLYLLMNQQKHSTEATHSRSLLKADERSVLYLLRKQKALKEELDELNETYQAEYQAKKAKLEESLFVVKVQLTNFIKKNFHICNITLLIIYTFEFG